jgi:CBS domain-containing protein
MTVRELVGGEVFSVDPSLSLRDAVRTMSSKEVGALAVVHQGRLTGILSERDVLRACAEAADLDETTTAEWMTRDPDSLTSDMSVDAAADWMLASGYRHLPILDGVDLVGMVSIKDVLWALTEPTSV